VAALPGGILALGLLSAVLGVLYALMEHDLKRMLAFHSIENIGIVLIGVGVGLILAALGQPMGAALGAGLFHALSHALFKALLFLGAGAMHVGHLRSHARAEARRRGGRVRLRRRRGGR